jgi:5-methylcytosine-specific restriction endonuclease McrA
MIQIITSNTNDLSVEYLHRSYPQHSKEVYINYYVLKQNDISLFFSTSYWKNNYAKYPKGFNKKIKKKDLTNFGFIKQKANRIKLLDHLGLPYNFIIKFMRKYYHKIGKSTLSYTLNEKTKKKQLKATKKRQQNPMVKVRKKIGKQFDIVEISDEKLLKHLGKKCYLCKEKINPLKTRTWEVDHIVPKISGGSGHIYNLGTTCRQCNRSKADYSMPKYIEYIEKQFYYIQENKNSLMNTHNKALKYSMK